MNCNQNCVRPMENKELTDREMGDGARRKRGREVSEERERERGLTRERFGGGAAR